jgi:hypothetical protein
MAGSKLAGDASPMPAPLARVAEEAKGVQQHTPQAVIGQSVHNASLTEERVRRCRREMGESGQRHRRTRPGCAINSTRHDTQRCHTIFTVVYWSVVFMSPADVSISIPYRRKWGELSQGRGDLRFATRGPPQPGRTSPTTMSDEDGQKERRQRCTTSARTEEWRRCSAFRSRSPRGGLRWV